MRRPLRYLVWLIPTLVLLLPALALAQSGGGYDLSWSAIVGGGYTFSEGSGYSLGGTIGQADAAMLSGGRYTLDSGFWGGGEVIAPKNHICLPLVLRTVP